MIAILLLQLNYSLCVVNRSKLNLLHTLQLYMNNDCSMFFCSSTLDLNTVNCFNFMAVNFWGQFTNCNFHALLFIITGLNFLNIFQAITRF